MSLKKHAELEQSVREALLEIIYAVIEGSSPAGRNLANGAPALAVLEAQVFAAYAVSNSGMVEAVLRASGEGLSDAWLPRFKRETSARMYGLREAKKILDRQAKQRDWETFIRHYHARHCAGWAFPANEKREGD